MLIHAAGESSPGNLPMGTYAIALEARDEPHLWRIRDVLVDNGIFFDCVSETDGSYAGQMMAIGVEPMERNRIKKLLSSLPLVGKKKVKT